MRSDLFLPTSLTAFDFISVIIPITYEIQFYTRLFVPEMSNLQWVNSLSGIQSLLSISSFMVLLGRCKK